MGHQAQTKTQPARQLHSWRLRKWLAVLSVLAAVSYCLACSWSSKTRPKAARVHDTGSSSAHSRGASDRDNSVAYEHLDEAKGYEAHPLTLQAPKYNLLVLRSILQHSNTSWQTTPKEARGHFVQSLVWMQMVCSIPAHSCKITLTCTYNCYQINGLRPVNPEKYMSATCTFGQYEAVTARIHPFDLHPGDRTTGHGFVFYVDCQLPEPLQATPHNIGEVSLAYVMDIGILTVPTLPEYHQPIRLRVGNMEVPLELTPPMVEKSEFAVCLSPLTWSWEDIPLWQLVEWRMHYAKLGVER